ncbi:MAG TPA: hypothetical protein VEF89_30385 [Solirubrobacteraceae bacterium]|nr:hypothetical protein [Solirubrobacteraceae bacterium]
MDRIGFGGATLVARPVSLLAIGRELVPRVQLALLAPRRRHESPSCWFWIPFDREPKCG